MRSQPPTVAKHRWPTPAERPARYAWRLRCDGLETGSMPDDRLAAYRRRIDDVDAELVRMLARRFRITEEIGQYKAAHGLPPVDLVRQHEQIDGLREFAVQEGLDPEFCEKFVHLVMDEVIRNHRRIAAAHGSRAS